MPALGDRPVGEAVGARGEPRPAATGPLWTKGYNLGELAGRGAIILLYVWLVLPVVDEWRRTGHITGLILVATSALIIYFTLRRRVAQTIEQSPFARIAAFLGTVAPLGLRPTAHSSVPDGVTAWLAVMGTIITISGIAALGRSFGVVAANRGIVRHGIYGLIRHPVYTGYVFGHAGFVLSFPSPRNIVLWVIADGLQLVRIVIEERHLRRDPAYASYMTRVRWRMLPGVF